MDVVLRRQLTPSDLGERSELLTEKHINFIVNFSKNEESLEHVATEYLKLSGKFQN